MDVSLVSVEGCSGDLVAGEGNTLTSPGYPGGYEGNLDCVWTITAPPNHKVWLNLTTVALEHHPNCLYDNVVIYSGQFHRSYVELLVTQATHPHIHRYPQTLPGLV